MSNDLIRERDSQLKMLGAEITKGIVSNPNVKISFERGTLFFDFDGKRINIASIMTSVIQGIQNVQIK